MEPKSVNHPRLLSSASAVALLLVVAIAVCPVRAANSDLKHDSDVSVATASAWLAEWDAGHWKACWNDFSSTLQSDGSLDKWSRHAFSVQEVLGKLQSRKLIGVQETRLRGKVMRVVFDVTFEHKGLLSEGVNVEKQSDGSWKVSGHWIKPKTAPWPSELLF